MSVGFWTTLQSIGTPGISRVHEYSIRSSTDCSNINKFDAHSHNNSIYMYSISVDFRNRSMKWPTQWHRNFRKQVAANLLMTLLDKNISRLVQDYESMERIDQARSQEFRLRPQKLRTFSQKSWLFYILAYLRHTSQRNQFFSVKINSIDDWGHDPLSPGYDSGGDWPMIDTLSEESGLKSFTTNKDTENASNTVMLNDSFSSVSGGSQYTYRTIVSSSV